MRKGILFGIPLLLAVVIVAVLWLGRDDDSSVESHVTLSQARAQYESARQAWKELRSRQKDQAARQRWEVATLRAEADARGVRGGSNTEETILLLADVLYFRARCLKALGEMGRARPYFGEALREYEAAYRIGEPTYKEAFQIGISLCHLRKWQEAVPYLETAEQVAADAPREAYWYLAEAHAQMAHVEKAAHYWRCVVKAYPAGSPYHQEAQRRLTAMRDKAENAPVPAPRRETD